MPTPARQAHSMPNSAAAVIAELAGLFGKRLATDAAAREAHGRDESYHPVLPPDAVVYAESTEEVAAVVRCCAAHGVPVIPFGVGTSLEGGVGALTGGISIDLDYPIHRYFLWAKHLELRLGAGTAQLDRLGIEYEADES